MLLYDVFAGIVFIHVQSIVLNHMCTVLYILITVGDV